MDPITIGGGLILLVGAAVSAAITHYKNKTAKLNAALNKFATVIGQYTKAYQFEECDKPIITAVKEYINTLRKDGKLSVAIAGMTDMKDRKDYMIKIVREIARLMNVELSDVNITDLGMYIFGQSYVESGKYKIDLNEALLVADPDRLLQTVCHELRHLQQMQALNHDKWGFSDNRKAQWMMALNEYVTNDEDSQLQYLAYVTQSIEIDANKFATEVTGESEEA